MAYNTKINTVNVVKIKNNAVDEVHTFPDTKTGNKDAEEKFLDLIKETISNYTDHNEDDLNAYLENGICTFGTGSICISNSIIGE